MSDGIDSGYLLVDLSSAEAIEKHAEMLRGMTFREVIDLGIVPEGVSREYNSKRYKGGMGTLIEERFFGYKANSVQGPDFEEAGVELKVTCFDVKKDGGIAAGERLVLTMIPFDSPIEDDFYESHVWEKSANIMLVYYERNRDIDSYDQVIRYTSLFTPPAEDLKIIDGTSQGGQMPQRSAQSRDIPLGATPLKGAPSFSVTRLRASRGARSP